jgi:hypothetical protein
VCYHATPFMSSFRCFGMPLTPRRTCRTNPNCPQPPHWVPCTRTLWTAGELHLLHCPLVLVRGGPQDVARWVHHSSVNHVVKMHDGRCIDGPRAVATHVSRPTCMWPLWSQAACHCSVMREAGLMPDSRRALTGWFRCEAGPLWPVSVRCAKNEIYSFPFPV